MSELGFERTREARALRAATAVLGLLFAAVAGATSVIPITDQELYRRADVVVHGVVVSSDATVDEQGRPEMLTVIEPIALLKGSLPGSLVIHQLGAELPDGRFLKMWGRPEYVPGSEVVVFAIRRPAGEYETAEMLLGKFRIGQDEAGVRFAIPELVASVRSAGVEVFDSLEDAAAGRQSMRTPGWRASDHGPDSLDGARELSRFLTSLARGSISRDVLGVPRGELREVRHISDRAGRTPEWGNINGSLWRWNNNATAGWSFNGTANITGGGTAEATGALAAWTNDPYSSINYTPGAGNVIYLNAMSSALGCGWSSCLSGGGVIGCGGPGPSGTTHSWRGDTYHTISSGTVELRAYCSLNGFDSITTQAVLTHELGHTLGLGHSDVDVSVHDVCRGDENAAQMRSIVQHSITLGTDDQDAIRWIYGDGGNSCAFTVTAITPSFGPTSGGTLVTIVGTGFQAGATVTIGGAGAAVSSVTATTIKATTPAGATGPADVVVTNPDTTTRTLAGGFTYAGASFYTLAPCRVIDTRNPAGPLGGPALVAGGTRGFTLTGQCGIPSGAKAISANVTVTLSSGAGDLRIYPGGGILPLTSVVNYSAGQTRANNAVLELGASGDISVRCDLGAAQFVLDVTGYFN